MTCLFFASRFSPTEVSPVVSSDNLLLFISAVTADSDEMYCVEASTGRLQWAHNSDDQGYVARPVYRSRDGDSRNGVLYTVSVSLIGMCAFSQ